MALSDKDTDIIGFSLSVLVFFIVFVGITNLTSEDHNYIQQITIRDKLIDNHGFSRDLYVLDTEGNVFVLYDASLYLKIQINKTYTAHMKNLQIISIDGVEQNV